MNKTLKNILYILLIVAIAFCMYGVPNFYSPDETRYSEVAREMLANHNFLVPYINGIIFFHKPPVVYWISCLFMSVFGENTWGARLVNPVLLGICLVFAYYVINKILSCSKTAFLSVMICLSTVMFLFLGRYLNIDLGIGVFLNMTLLCYWCSLKFDSDYKISTFWLLMAFVFSGIAVMTKGLMGIVFPMAIVGIYSVIMGNYKRLFDIRLYIGLIIVAVISLPWVFMVDKHHPNFAYYYIVVQQILRYSTNEQDRQVWKIVYVAAVLGALFPWTFFLPQLLKKYINIKAFKDRKNNPNIWFLIAWASFIFLFFGFSKSFLFGYLAPLILPICILITIYIKNLDTTNITRWDKCSFAIPIFVFSLLPIACVVILCLPNYRPFISQLAIILIPMMILISITVFYAIRAFKQTNIKQMIICFVTCMIVLANFGYAAGEYLDYHGTKDMAYQINKVYEKYPQTQVYESDRFYDVPFYTGKNVIIINDQGELDDIKSFPNSGTDKYLTNYDSFIKMWNNSKDLKLLLVINRSSKLAPKSISNYRASIDKNKFFVLDENKYVTLVSNKNITSEIE